MGYEVVRLEADGAAGMAAGIEQIARGAFAANADFGTPEGAQMIARAVVGHATNDGYRCWVAIGEGGRPIGFAYGFRSFEIGRASCRERV